MLLSTIGLAACGGSSASTDDATCVDAATLAADGIRGGLAVAARDDRFDPACITTDASQVTIVLRNEGGHPHNLQLDDGRRISVDAGQVAVLDDVEVTVGGTTFVCTLHPGMTGELVRAST